MKKMTKFFALALLAGAMVSCNTEDTAPSVQNDKVAVQFTGGINVNTRASGTTWDNGDRIGITDIGNSEIGIMLHIFRIGQAYLDIVPVGQRPGLFADKERFC